MPYIGSALRRVLLLYIKRENGRFRRGVRVWPKEHGWKPCKQGIVSRVRIPSSPYGRLAQLGEHLPYKQGVTGSIPVTSIMGLYANWINTPATNRVLQVRVLLGPLTNESLLL